MGWLRNKLHRVRERLNLSKNGGPSDTGSFSPKSAQQQAKNRPKRAFRIISASQPYQGSARTPAGIKRGAGNWYARQGMAQEFIGLTRAEEIAERVNMGAGE